MNRQSALFNNYSASIDFAIDESVDSIPKINVVNKNHKDASYTLDAIAAHQLVNDSEAEFLGTIKVLLKFYSVKELLACSSFNPVREWVREQASANEIMAMLQHHIDPINFGIEISEYATIANRSHPNSTLKNQTATLIELASHIQKESEKAA